MIMPRKIKHAYIPDLQLKKGVKMDHITGAGHYIAEHLDVGDSLILAGDVYDMPSLSSYDNRGDVGWEHKNVIEDLQAGNRGLQMLHSAVEDVHPGLWEGLRKVVTMGNHEDRLRRVRELARYRRFKALLSDDMFEFKIHGFKVVPYQKFITINGIIYCHNFVNPLSLTGGIIGGTVHNKLNKLKCSFTMGHQQGLDLGMQYIATGKRIRGLVAGSFYQHDEDYMGPQKNTQHWRGMIIKHEVHAGDYDLLELSLDYILERWT